jgi:hypothetical protein
MKMLLRDLTFVELASVLKQHEGCSPMPHLIDPDARKRARRTAKQNGVWSEIESELDPSRIIPAIKRSEFRHYKRTGIRTRHQKVEQARSQQMELAALALWLGHPSADLDYLQDLLWAYCDDYTWVMAAHEVHGMGIDLGSAMRGARLAEILHALEDQIEPEVANRVHAEIETRIFDNLANRENTEFWHTARMNWNHVCNGGLVRTALLEIKDARVLANVIHPIIQNMTYALDGFTDDGGCEEGASYWGFGFGHFVQAAHALHCRTEGELNIMSDEKIARISRFPLVTHIDGITRANFADCGHGAVAILNALQINHFLDVPELYELCARRDSGKPTGPGPLQVKDMHSLALYHGEKATGTPDQRDYIMPNLGTVKMRGNAGPSQMTVAAIAGNNGVPHSHNDVGSFLVFKRGRLILTDPGGPVYNSKTFSDQRYDILYCRSRGHSVPIINGREQKSGAWHCGTLTVESLNSAGTKLARIDMTRAYPRGTVRSLVRTLELDHKSNTLNIEDAYTFSKKPRTIEESFVTFEKAKRIKNGRAVQVGPVRGGAILTAAQPGKFQVKSLRKESEDAKPGGTTLMRITFVPDRYANSLVLRFHLR